MSSRTPLYIWGMEFYDHLRSKSHELESFVGGLPVLSGVFTPEFFEKVRGQVAEMGRTGRVGPLHSMFIFLVKDDQIDDKRQTILLEDYLGKVLSHPDVLSQASIGNHIKAQLISGDQHVHRLFEISILGNLISQLSYIHFKTK